MRSITVVVDQGCLLSDWVIRFMQGVPKKAAHF